MEKRCSIYRIWIWIGLILAVFVMAGCRAKPMVPPSSGDEAVGWASYYGKKFHGRKTASGERFNMHAMTAAHKRLAFGTVVKVTHIKNGRSVNVRINDRGPFTKGRIIDLSYGAAKKLGMISQGIAKVRLKVVRK